MINERVADGGSESGRGRTDCVIERAQASGEPESLGRRERELRV